MIDDFMRELFGPDTGGGAPATFGERFGGIRPPLFGDDPGPATFGERFGGGQAPHPEAAGLPDLLKRLMPGMVPGGGGAAPMMSPGNRFEIDPQDHMERPRVIEMSAKARRPDAVPLPPARPGGDLMERLGGGSPGAPLSLAPPAPTNPAAPAAPPSLMARLRGGGSPPPAGSDPRGGLLARLTGMDPRSERRVLASLAGGMAGGNPAFSGGALMKGLSGGISGGLASDQQDRKEDKDASTAAQKQSNFERTQGDKEKTSEALRMLYRMRGEVMKTNADTHATNAETNAGRKTWNKPAHERFKDAERLILDKEKALRNPLAAKADRDAAERELADYRKKVYRQYGFSDDGTKDIAPGAGGKAATPSTDKVVGDKEGEDAGLYAKGTYDDPATPTTQEEFDALEPGSVFINPKTYEAAIASGLSPDDARRKALMTKRGNGSP